MPLATNPLRKRLRRLIVFLTTMESFECTIEKMVHGGAGLARTDTGVVFVVGGLPGERVRAVTTGTVGSVLHARAEKILIPSPDRRQPFCPYVGVCGGCNWQYSVPAAQVLFKTTIFKDCLARVGKIAQVPEIETFSAADRGYRHRVQFKIDENGGAGFYARGTNQVIPIDSCPLLVPELNDLLNAAHGQLQGIRVLKAIAGNSGVASAPVLDGITGNATTIQVGTTQFAVDGDGFFQQNRFLLEPLGTWAHGLLTGKTVIDLFGGCGFFSVCIAAEFDDGLLVENDPALVGRARENFDANGLDRFQALALSTESFFRSVPEKFQSPDCIIVDPPRTGLTREVRRGVVKLRPRQLLYVSCDPATQARDCGFFVNTCNYRLARAALFDLYPNTHHLETALLLTVPE